LIRLHILHHAVQEPIFCQELSKNWRVTAITQRWDFYPMLHDMERYLHSVEERSGRQLDGFTGQTDLGKTMLEDAREKSVSCLVNCLKSSEISSQLTCCTS